jgi:hypothetical protein
VRDPRRPDCSAAPIVQNPSLGRSSAPWGCAETLGRRTILDYRDFCGWSPAQNAVEWQGPGAKPLRVNSPQRKNAPRVHSIPLRQRKTRPRVHSSVHAEPFCAETVYTRSLFSLTSVHAEPFFAETRRVSVHAERFFAEAPSPSTHSSRFCAGAPSQPTTRAGFAPGSTFRRPIHQKFRRAEKCDRGVSVWLTPRPRRASTPSGRSRSRR